MQVDAKTADGQSATFTAKVTSSTYGAAFGTPWVLPGSELTWKVYDNGEGVATGIGDYYDWLGVTNGAAGTGDVPYPPTAGNIQILSNS